METQDVLLPSKRFDQAIAYTLKNDKEGVKTLLAKNGYDASKLNDNGLHIAFLKAVKDSPVFRSDVASHMTGVVGKLKAFYAKFKPATKAPALNFVNQPQLGFVNQPGQLNCNGGMNFVNQPQLGFVNQPGALNADGYKPHLNYVDDFSTSSDLSDTLPGSATVTITTAPAPTSTTKASGSFWDSLGSLASKDNLNKLFNTGLDTLSTTLKNNSNASTEQNALELERLRLQQIQAANEKQTGMSTGIVVLIVVLAAAAVGTGIYFAMKKKKA